MSKEQWLAAHERLTNEDLDRNPKVDWLTAYNRTVDQVNDRMREDMADKIDQARQQAKDGQ